MPPKRKTPAATANVEKSTKPAEEKSAKDEKPAKEEKIVEEKENDKGDTDGDEMVEAGPPKAKRGRKKIDPEAKKAAAAAAVQNGSSRSLRAKKQVDYSDKGENSSEKPKAEKKGPIKKTKAKDEDDDGKDKDVAAPKKRGRQPKATPTPAAPSAAKKAKTEKKAVQEDDNDSDSNNQKEEEKSAASSNKRGPKAATKKKATATKKEGDDLDGDDNESENSEVESKKGKGKKADKKDIAAKELLNQADTKWDDIDFSNNKKNEEGNDANLKITSWNVDGIRAWLKKDGLTILKYEKPDIFCLQETKCSHDKLPDELKDVEGYQTYWCASDKDGYAGVALFSKTEPINVKYGIGVDQHDDEGRCITAEYEKFYVVCVYVPNAGRKLVTLPKRLEWNKAFKTFIKELDAQKPVIICGDMNVAHNEIDLANPKSNTKNAGFTKEEREGMTEFLSEGFVDTYRKLYPNEKDVYTFWSYITKARAKNVGWRLDYFIVSERIMKKVCDNVVRSGVFGSDHCPVTLFINI